jgi:hypothetical protein
MKHIGLKEKHRNLKENYVCKVHHLGLAKISHFLGVINVSNIFTKELKDSAHLDQCCDDMME